MPTIEDRIADELRRAAPRPGDNELFERIEVRMRRRRLERRLGSVALATVVVAGTLAGYLALNRAFRGTEPRPATPSVVQPTPEPSATPEPGRDLGLGFRVCNVQGKQNIDFFGNGSDATVWTGIPVQDGSCLIDDLTAPIENTHYVVAIDFDDDGRADAWTRLAGYCTGCEPFAATDFDADGTKELVVLLSYGTTPQYGVYDVGSPDSEEGPSVAPIPVHPGNAQAGFPDGEPIVFWAGGDEGLSASVACEGYPDHPILIVSWTLAQVDGPTRDVSVTRFRLANGTFEMLSSNNFTQPAGDPLPSSIPSFNAHGEACGVDFNPFL